MRHHELGRERARPELLFYLRRLVEPRDQPDRAHQLLQRLVIDLAANAIRTSPSHHPRGPAPSQVATTTPPPGRRTRRHSRRAAVGSGMKKTTNAETMTSN